MTKAKVYALIEDHFRKNYKIGVNRISRYLGSRHNAEDVMQEAYYRACLYWKSFKPDIEFNKWFSYILDNAIKRFFNKEITRGMAQDVQPVDPFPKQMLQRIELAELLKLLEAEEEDVRRILHLYLIEDYSSYEVADIVPESASNIRKIVERFRAGLKDHGKR